jgi:hypothetical protein
MTCGAVAWDVSRKNRSELLAAEMDYRRRSRRKTILDKIWCKAIRETMEMEKDIIDEVQKRQLIWFDHTNRMGDTRWTSKLLK